MRLEKIDTKPDITAPKVIKDSDQYKVLDINGVERKVFEDIDLAKLWMKKHKPELAEGKEPVVYMSEIMEGVLDATDEDGWMAKSQLYRMSKYAIELHGMIGDTDNLVRALHGLGEICLVKDNNKEKGLSIFKKSLL